MPLNEGTSTLFARIVVSLTIEPPMSSEFLVKLKKIKRANVSARLNARGKINVRHVQVCVRTCTFVATFVATSLKM